jgi:hypothetical protein
VVEFMFVGDGGAMLTVVCAIVTVGATLIITGVILMTVDVGSREGDGDTVESKVMKQSIKMVIN